VHLTRRRRRHPQRIDRKQRYGQYQETDYHQQQRGGSLAAQGLATAIAATPSASVRIVPTT
jgi:hypothetical protein